MTFRSYKLHVKMAEAELKENYMPQNEKCEVCKKKLFAPEAAGREALIGELGHWMHHGQVGGRDRT